MAAKTKSVRLKGSKRKAPKGSRKLTAADEALVDQVTVRLRSKTKQSSAELAEKLALTPLSKRRYATREEQRDKRGAADADVKAVERFAHQAGLTVAETHQSSRVVKLRGTVGALRRAFRADLRKWVVGGRTYRVREGDVSIPSSLKGIVKGVHGLDNRPVAKPHFRRRSGAQPNNAQDASLSVAQVAAAYHFPSNLNGAGQTIAIIELNDTDDNNHPINTGYTTVDLSTFFKKNNLSMPEIVPQGVDGGANVPNGQENPQSGSNNDDEVTLDIEIAGAVAPGARIVVYFAPNTTAGFIDAVKAAAHDTTYKPSVISISWGGPEDPDGATNQAFMDGLSEAIADASNMGVTVCVAAGDNGSADMAQGWDGEPHADFPASAPFSLACGGSKLVTANGAVAQETVWNAGTKGGAGGGGVSNYFPKPAWQANAAVPLSPNGKKNRGIPDMSGNADSATGYRIYLDNADQVYGGTSAVAPLFAGLMAQINQARAKKSAQPVGCINSIVYAAKAAPAFRDIAGNNDIDGSLNGEYTARNGWDACSGMGVPDGSKLLALLAP